MKKDGHPAYQSIIASCHCGAEFNIGSTDKEVRVDSCSQCHPLFLGKKDTSHAGKGVVDKFTKRYAGTAQKQAEIKERKERKEELTKLDTEIKTRKKQRVIGKTKI